MRRFLQDYYSGNWADLEKFIPRPAVERIVARSSETGYAGLVSPERISFPYGPDIIRDAQGGWRVIEDNPGFIGGPGDLVKAREVLLKRIPEYRDKIKAVDSPEKFYDELIKRYRPQRNPPSGKIVLYMVPPYADNEDQRLRRLFSSRGVEVITPHTRKKLITNENGVFIEETNSAGNILRKPVGYLILNGEHSFMDNTHPVPRERALIEEAKAHLESPGLKAGPRKNIEKALIPDPETGRVDWQRLEAALDQSSFGNGVKASRKLQAKGLMDAILSGKVATNYSPGVDFIGDKEFYVYVEEMIRHYSGEEPILRNIPTERFSRRSAGGKISVDEKIMDRVFKNPEKYVIKAVDGRGGDAVWVGAKIPRKDFLAVREQILKEPERFIVQEFTHLSVLDGKIVDLRMISAVDPHGVYVSPTPWGRALPIDGDGKVNLSSSGRELAVVVTRSRPEESDFIRCFKKNFHPQVHH